MDTVSQIKQRLDITDVIAGYITLKKAGKNYKALCPFHSEDTPSFMVSPELQIFKCFGCGEGGDMFNFVEKVEGVDFPQALEMLAEKAGVKIERKDFDPNYKKKAKLYEINELATEFYHHLLTNHESGKKALKYLKEKRGLTDRTIAEFRLGYAPNTWDTLHKFLIKKGYINENQLLVGAIQEKRDGTGFIDKFRGRITFPLIDTSGKIVGFSGRDIVGRDPKYLNTQETMIFNKSAFIYGLNTAKVDIKKEGVVFVEGQMDVIKAWQNSIKNVVAISGTSLTSLQLKILSRYTKEITFCFDSDEAGMKATTRALTLTEPHDFEVKVAMIPKSYDDLDDYLTKSVSAAKKTINNPVPIYDFYLASALKMFEPETAYGKKKIVSYLAPLFAKIQNKVVLDHYVKELASAIESGEDTIKAAIESPQEYQQETKGPTETTPQQEELKQSPEEYLLSLLLKSDLDTMGQFLYKINPEDLSLKRNQIIFNKLKEYFNSKPSQFDIKYFTEELGPDYKDEILGMYLWDFGVIEQKPSLFVNEIESTILRIRKDSVRRELKNLTEQIKLAELEKNTEKIKELTERSKELSKLLI